ncbi:MAG: RagB/SusD family nutrient uptake outer membrane protein [Tidjanibacter sp.]|nr:RagB/SusD family nutrient uptake outer membrane protein [Tidjanibacter sp.]
MKKIIFLAITALTTLFVSCDMEKLPYSAIEETEAVQSMEDAVNLRISVYSPTKGMFGGMRWDVEEMRGGLFNAKADFGNYYGLFYAWTLQASDNDASGPWFSDYSIIASCNFAIKSFENLLENNADLTEKDKATLKDFIAEAYMTRVMAYWDLVTKYCVAYDPATASETHGLPLQKEYAPTSDRSKYPGRSSLEETYQFILSDLEEAGNLTTKGEANSKYWTIDCVNAMRARVLLNMKMYEEAYDVALALVQSTTYSLANDKAKLNAMWNTDASSELLFASAGSFQDPPTATGSYYIYDNSAQDGSTPNSQYLPSQTLIDLYGATPEERAKDRRYSIYFQTRPINVESVAKQDLEVFWKFVGNPIYRSKESIINYRNAGKPFRLAEQYLILAECAANLNMATDASTGTVKWLTELRNARLEEGASLPITANNAMNYVKDEWNREFVGEGFRMINMKRWGDKIIRGTSQNPKMTKSGKDYDGLEKEITDSRCVWPIPKAEIDANPQIGWANQNPGY